MGIRKHIRSKHPSLLRFVDVADGGTKGATEQGGVASLKPEENLAPNRVAEDHVAQKRKRNGDAVVEELKFTPYEDKARAYDLERKMRRPNRKLSAYWMFFHTYASGSKLPEQCKEPNRIYACCNYCGTDLVCDSDSGTMGIRKHIRTKHPSLLRFVDVADGGTKSATGNKNLFVPDPPHRLGKRPKLSGDKYRDYQVECTAKWLVMDNVPFTMLKSEWYRKHLFSFNSSAQPPSVEKVTEKITQIDDEVRKKVMEIIEDQAITLTTDHWTSNANDNYSALTAHWISGDWKLNSLLLGCFHHQGDTNGKALCDTFLVQLFHQCQLTKVKIVAVVGDTTANMSQFGELLEKLDIPHVFCIDHTLQLTAQRAYDDENFGGRGEGIVNTDTAMEAARSLCEFFSKSTQAVDRLKLSQTALPNHYGEREPVGVVRDVMTRWWSTYNMCDRLLYLRKAFEHMILAATLPPEKGLTPEQWSVISQTREVLMPFKLAQENLEARKHVTISMVPRSISKCRKQLESKTLDVHASPEVRRLASNLLDDFNTRWSCKDQRQFSGSVRRGYRTRQAGLHPLHCVAAALDPRTKFMASLCEADRNQVWQFLMELMSKNLPDHPGNEEGKKETKDVAKKTELFFDEDSDDADYREGLTAKMTGASTKTTPSVWRSRCGTELEGYKQLDQLKGDADPLKWWREQRFNFPILSDLVRQYLAVPASSATSERVFNVTSSVIAEKRSSLDPAFVGKILFINQNLEWWEKEVNDRS